LIKHDHLGYESELESLIKSYPNSRLGQLLYADLLAIRAGLTPAIDRTMEHLGKDLVSRSRKQLRTRWQYWHTTYSARRGLVPSALLRLKRDQRWILYMDIPAGRLIVFENKNGQLKKIGDFYASIGIEGYNKREEGDQKTPVGVYHTTGFIPGRKLHERYGAGAFPINYPNKLDQLYGRTGSGIWIHGTEPDFINRAPQASDGCLSVSNEDFLAINNIIGNEPFVPIIIDGTPDWITKIEQNRRRKEVQNTLQNWREAAATLKISNLGRFYSTYYQNKTLSVIPQLFTPGIGKNLPFTELHIADMQFFEYPGESGFYVVDLSLQMSEEPPFDIRQYWHRIKINKWVIISEFQVLSGQMSENIYLE